MSAAEDAYRAAEAAIEEAKRTGAEGLGFEDEAFRALVSLPPRVSALDKLRTLNLNSTQVSDLAPLRGLTRLQSLSLRNTRVSDLAPLTGLTGLYTLWLDSAQVSDLAPLKGLKGLWNLGIERTQVTDLAPLKGLTGLHSLWLDSTIISDFDPLRELVGLETLSLSGTQVSDLDPLKVLTGLQYLSLNNTQVRDFRPLQEFVGLHSLTLNGTGLSDLDPLNGLTGLQYLLLNNTQVRDLDPLKGIRGLRTLRLDSTQVLDLRPLAGLRKLADEPEYDGLSFLGSSATADPKIAEIAEIEDPKARAKALFALLDAGWKPPVAVEPVPLEPDPLLRSILIDSKLEIAPDPPTEEERRDRVKAVLHERLKEKAKDLSALAGNRFPRLANRARALVALLDRPFDELDMLSVHVEIEDLEDRRATAAEDGETYTEDVQNAVADLTRAGPGLTVGHPDVDTFLDRRRRSREDVVRERDDAVHRRLSQAVIDDAAANGPNSRAMEELLLRVADEAAARALWEAKHQNLIWTLVVPAVSLPRDVAINVTATLIATAYGPSITAFVTSNYGLLSEVAATYGQGVLLWFQQNVGPLIAGIDTTVIRPLERPKREKR